MLPTRRQSLGLGGSLEDEVAAGANGRAAEDVRLATGPKDLAGLRDEGPPDVRDPPG